ncbi:MAG: ribonuclease Z [Neisseriaceae bacterium]
MKLLFLGTAAGTTTKARNTSALLLRWSSPRADSWLFDCGERTYHYLQLGESNIDSISKIFITHLHADHVLGLLALLFGMSVKKRRKTLMIFGPEAIGEWIRFNLKATYTTLAFSLEIKEHSTNQLIYQENTKQVYAYEMLHRCPSFAYRVEELAITATKCEKQMDAKEHISLETSPSKKKIVTIFGDTQPNANELLAAQNADLVIHEATFRDDLAELAKKYGHSTAREAAQMAKKAGVKRLLLTHLSSRYSSRVQREALLQEAREELSNTDLADDFLEFEV